jgi:hypothetical protein
MRYSTLYSINIFLFFVDLFLFLFLIGLATYSFFKKNPYLFKLSILYLVNQAVLTITSLKFLTDALIITQGPKGNSESAAISLLKKYAVNIFLEDAGYSVLLSILLVIFNFSCQRIFSTIITKKHLIQLFLVDLIILLFISWFSAEWYYSNILAEVQKYFDYYNHRF